MRRPPPPPPPQPHNGADAPRWPPARSIKFGQRNGTSPHTWEIWIWNGLIHQECSASERSDMRYCQLVHLPRGMTQEEWLARRIAELEALGWVLRGECEVKLT
ncbi:hypothetical protein ACFWYW_58405 [Nonomuraea sp. NPDC059023]|uniref:hypothetical protein n=1 Tax=unclassified Nonomuraea TaxID=2593643 RepID=UPI00367EA4E6